MKKLIVLFLLSIAGFNAFATHISGGELIYEYVGPVAATGTSQYRITLKLFRDCGSAGQVLDGETPQIGVYNAATSSRVTIITLTRTWTGAVPTISYIPGSNPCIQGQQDVCYQVGTFSGVVELANQPMGYTLAWIRYTRYTPIENVSSVVNVTGATFITTIPGTDRIGSNFNSSPQFGTNDASLVCRNNYFTLDYSATDPNFGDSLSYKFGVAYDGTAGPTPPNPSPPATLVLPNLSYISPFTPAEPLGSQVTLNPLTGQVSGIAPSTPGKYVVCIIAEEWRNGVLINEHRKDFILSIKECDIPAPISNFKPVTCDGFSFTFPNESTGNIQNYFWDFGTGNAADVSTAEFPTFTFADTGIYQIKLVINRGGSCTDSITRPLGVYPGFFAGFTTTGSCFQTPFQFTDTTKTKYGTVSEWRWDFGNTAATNDTAIIQNPSYQYPAPGTYNTQFIVANSKGCRDTVFKDIVVLDKPALILNFKDTLICSIDTLQLIANGDGVFSWTPNYNIINPSSATPLVYPKNTTTYTVNLNKDGCLNSDTVRVNVVDPNGVFVILSADTGICRTDTAILVPKTNALKFNWIPNISIVDPTAKNAAVFPTTTIDYTLTGSVGKCPASDVMKVSVGAYPVSNAGRDTAICFGERTQLNGSVSSPTFNWTPVNTLQNPTTLTPTAFPITSTNYILTAIGYEFCPKSVNDTVLVKVIPPVNAFAGNDTTVVITQPLQFNATGGTNYTWSPATYLNRTDIPNPVGIYDGNIDSIRYYLVVTTDEGCIGYDTVTVRIFKTVPGIFVPTGFTPNGDGLNDILRPILAGMQRLDYFRIYNRWGQVMYSTTREGQGWNGLFEGAKQPSGTFVYMAQALDYTGKKVFVKGTVVLIR